MVSFLTDFVVKETVAMRQEELQIYFIISQ